jgi:nicotinamidase-related amidase
MQRLFSTDGPWPTPWMDRVLPVVATLADRYPERTLFTRFIPPERATDMPGMWQYSAFMEPQLLSELQSRGADGLIVTGSETDVCVLATVLSAVDLGYRVVVVEDAICSSSDEGHDALMQIYCQRYSEQIEVADAATIMDRWVR